MTTARALLRRLLRRGRLDPRLTSTTADQPAADQRLDAARQRLKQTIPPPEEEGGEGHAIPPPEGVSPGEGSQPVP